MTDFDREATILLTDMAALLYELGDHGVMALPWWQRPRLRSLLERYELLYEIPGEEVTT